MDVAVLTPKESALGSFGQQRLRLGKILSLRVELVFNLHFLFHKYLLILCKN